MNKKLIGLLGLDAKASDEQIVAAVQALQAELNLSHQADAQRAEDEKLIALKVSQGLSREQAAVVIERQRKFDANKEKAAKKKPANSKLKNKS